MEEVENIIIKKSNIGQFDNDLGIFANRDFKKGEIVVKYNLKDISQKEFDELSEGEKEFTHTFRGQLRLYSIPERYVNHSNNPNTIQDLENECDIALREIKKGEEITTDATKDNG